MVIFESLVVRGDGHRVGQEWYDMRAECLHHLNCTLSRTCRGSMRAGAGRPICNLWAWLEAARGASLTSKMFRPLRAAAHAPGFHWPRHRRSHG